MSRITSCLVVAASLYATNARAGQAEIAAQLNEEGKNLMFGQKYAEASEKFAQAVARVPEPKYFFNLCMSRYQEGKFGDAITACESAQTNGADDTLKGKIGKLEDKIRDTAKQQGVTLTPTGGGASPGDTPPVDPNAGGGTTTTTGDGTTTTTGGGTTTTGGGAVGTAPAPAFAVGRPPSQGLFMSGPPEHSYTWTLGIDLFVGGGKIGGTDMTTNTDYYGNAAGGFRIKSDYLLNAASKIGAQGYLQVTHLNANQVQMASTSAVDTLDVIDLGVAAYKHFCQGSGRLCFTPLAGIQLALFSPAGSTDSEGSQAFNYSALGARVEAGLSYALGPRYEHVLSVQVGANLYTKPFASPSDCASTNSCADQIGLDAGGRFGYFGVGYTYRFNTPLGQAPFVTLE
jgi:hypothetical protein